MWNKNLFLLGLLVVGILLNTSLPSVAKKLASFSSSQSHIYYGVHVPGWPSTLSNLYSFEKDAGKAVSIVMWYQAWGASDGMQNFHPSWMNNVRNRGSIPMITWESWNPTQGINQPTYSLQNIINGDFDAYITQWALASKAWGHPYFLRFDQEMNSNWYPWCEQTNGNLAGQYVKAWKHIHAIFLAQGVTTVTWVWSPNVGGASTTPLSELYPGDSYVDWAGMDGYNWGNLSGHIWRSLADVFEQTYTDLIALTTKPLMIAETASTEQGGDKAAWITDGLGTTLMTTLPQAKAFVWFNENKETDWRIESSASATGAFAQAVAASVYTTNQYQNLNSSPIPPP